MRFDVYKFYEELTRLRVPIRLDAGDPDIPPHPEIVEVLRRELENLSYAPASGIMELKERIAELHGVDVNEVAVVPGSKAAIAALIHASRKTCMIAPYWPGYKAAAELFGKETLVLEASPSEGWVPRFDDIRDLESDVDTLIVNYPNNPTGAVIGPREARELAEIADDKGLILVSDEAYRDIVFEGDGIIMANFRVEKTVSVYSFSKTFSLPGLRIGYAVGDPSIISKIVKFVSSTYTSVPIFAQKAAIKALELLDEVAESVRRVYRNRLELFKRYVDKSKFHFVEPKGTFYVFLRVRTGISGRELALRLARRGVGVFPGEAFGSKYSEYVRVSLTRPAEEIRRALEIMSEEA